MLWYSNASINYAWDRCVECPGYSVGIYISHQQISKCPIWQRNDLKEDNIVKVIQRSNSTNQILFCNGSRIRFFSPSDSSRGNKVHLAIVSPHVGDDVISNVIRGSEISDSIDRQLNINTFNDNTLRQWSI